jgi:uncharacterized DUF497 family protein
MIEIKWSARKNRINIAKHKVDFSEAATVFDDPAHASILIWTTRSRRTDT